MTKHDEILHCKDLFLSCNKSKLLEQATLQENISTSKMSRLHQCAISL